MLPPPRGSDQSTKTNLPVSRIVPPHLGHGCHLVQGAKSCPLHFQHRPNWGDLASSGNDGSVGSHAYPWRTSLSDSHDLQYIVLEKNQKVRSGAPLTVALRPHFSHRTPIRSAISFSESHSVRKLNLPFWRGTWLASFNANRRRYPIAPWSGSIVAFENSNPKGRMR